MNYQESLDYLYGLQRFGIKLGLENIRTLLERLGRPDRSYATVHVGGTNGKGSVSAALAEILRRGGYRAGLYTSPHLHSFTERIRVDGSAISEAEVAALTAEIRSAATGIPATFFEFTTALALLHFQRTCVDIAVLEVGMGGRLDATNAVLPRLSVITPICRDHAEHLGDSLAAIAGEKGGIIKPDVPVVIGLQPAAALAVLTDRAGAEGAPLYLRGRDFVTRADPPGFSFHGLGLDLRRLRPGLAGSHQHENLSLSLAAAALLCRQEFDLPEEALRGGIEHVRWPGRLEWWEDGREVLLDGAHNEGGAQVLASYLASFRPEQIRWVVGIKGDKTAIDILGPLLPRVGALYCTAPPAESAVPPQMLAAAGWGAGRPAAVFASAELALEAALADRQTGEFVLVAGSLFLVGAAREYLQRRSG